MKNSARKVYEKIFEESLEEFYEEFWEEFLKHRMQECLKNPFGNIWRNPCVSFKGISAGISLPIFPEYFEINHSKFLEMSVWRII